MHLRRFYPLPQASGGGGPLTLNVIPSSPVQKYNPLPSGTSQQSVFASASGGVPPYTYLWTFVSGSSTVYNSTPTTEPTLFNAIGNGGPVNTKNAIWNIEVTDAAMSTVDEDVTIEFLFGLEPP